MCEAPGSVVTLLCSGIQLYSAERRIADCILADVKRASMCTSAELARLSSSSEATITRLCHKLGFENYRKFQLALARDAMEQQETARRTREEGQDELRQALLDNSGQPGRGAAGHHSGHRHPAAAAGALAAAQLRGHRGGV